MTCARSSPTGPLDTCGRLYPNIAMRLAGWIIGVSSFIGNMAVLIVRHGETTQSRVQTLFISNLAIADCLMGVYMIIITSIDIYFGNQYFLSAPIWRESKLCKFTSVLAFLASECSVFTLTLMTVDRFISIMFPFGKWRMSLKSARILILMMWTLMLALAVIPLLVGSDVRGFYGLSDVCIGLPLHAESVQTGRLEAPELDFDSTALDFRVEYVVTESVSRPSWIYSNVTFIGVNMVLFLIIAICYVMMFIQVKRSSRSVGNVALRDREYKVAVKMAFIVGTDFACWMPIIIMGILTQSGLVVLPTSLYAWSVIFIIPINSSINPILYTFINYIDNRKKPAEQMNRKNDLRKFKTTITEIDNPAYEPDKN
ncbi:G-protein coupled receptor GRL101-like [Lytechinus pictus]|uniref:G-protein coupled receptor GRL101-like n=1 Tax=Lytechinus pictus TaxID=7653 RepID=UPI0030B9D513